MGEQTMQNKLEFLLERVQKQNPQANIKKIRAAYECAAAAHEGSEASKQFVSKFGRAKSYGEQTIGTPDAGATSMAYFFKGLSKAN